MKFVEVETGTKIELELFNKLGETVKPVLVSQYEWMENTNTAIIDAPIQAGTVYPVRIDTLMYVYFIHKGDLYRFKAKVLDRGLRENLALLKIGVCSDIERIQRRQFYRFECTLPIRFRMVDSFDPGLNVKIPFKNAVTEDISGGGLCVILGDDKLTADELIECELQLEEKSTIRFFGKVVRANALEPGDRYKYRAGIRFKKIEDRDREIIISYIFQQQRKLRKKGLI